MDTLLEIKNLNLSFDINDKLYPCLKDVSLKLKKGEIHSIIGESGSGKTMTVTCAVKLLPKNAKITSGEVIYQNQNLLSLSEREADKLRGSKIAYIPQDPMTSLNPLLTIESQMTEAILAHNKSLTKKEAVEIALKSLKEVKIQDAENKLKAYPFELSGGLRQRVIIATALSLNPEIIIADEPTTALDVTVQAQILELLYEIKNKGKSIILISHDLGIVNKWADYISIMYLGRIVESANKSTLFSNPKHPYTKALIEALPYNKEKRLKNIKGAPASITEMIAGCEFHPRCEFAQDICKNKIFPLKKAPDGSFVSCRLFE